MVAYYSSVEDNVTLFVPCEPQPIKQLFIKIVQPEMDFLVSGAPSQSLSTYELKLHILQYIVIVGDNT